MRHEQRSPRVPRDFQRQDWASSVTVESYLEGLNYPASRQDVLDTAKSNGASEDVVQTLRQFSDHMYNSPVDVSQELGLIK
jgi:hypothetical protein